MTQAALVVPDIPSFSVDKGFWYEIPDHLASDISVGSVVRVPLSGRRTRGWVVSIGERDKDRLKEIAAISGSVPVFDTDMLGSLRWAATHYISPLSTIFARATPPNLPRKLPRSAKFAPPEASQGGLMAELAQRSSQGLNAPITAIAGSWQTYDWLAEMDAVFEAGRSSQIVTASAVEAEEVGERARARWGDIVATAAGESDAIDTRAWEASQVAPRLLVGTPRSAVWRVEGLALAVVLEEGRRAMKDRQTPTLHVRDVMRTRSRVESFNLVFLGPTPSVEALAEGADMRLSGNRAWPLVEIVDRSAEQSGSGYLSEQTIAAIRGFRDEERRIFVFTHRRAAFGSARCMKCRAVRSCRVCDRRTGISDTCVRCGSDPGRCSRCGGAEFESMGTVPDRLAAEINRRVGRGTASVHPGATTVTVGTERDLAGLDPVDLAVIADLDGLLVGVGHRVAEEALRVAARLATKVSATRGARLLVQTSRPDSLLVQTLRRGDPVPYLERVLVERAREGAPPAVEMIVLELRGDVPPDAAEELRAIEGLEALGPMAVDDGQRWLVTGRLDKARPSLRTLVGSWRDKGATVRVDVDPIDL